MLRHDEHVLADALDADRAQLGEPGSGTSSTCASCSTEVRAWWRSECVGGTLFYEIVIVRTTPGVPAVTVAFTDPKAASREARNDAIPCRKPRLVGGRASQRPIKARATALGKRKASARPSGKSDIGTVHGSRQPLHQEPKTVTSTPETTRSARSSTRTA